MGTQVIPNFTQYLPSREMFVTNWDHATPFQSSYVDGIPTPTYRFRHRPRVGRGGRVIIDRYPVPTTITSHHNYIAGEGIMDNHIHKNKKNAVNVGLLDL